MKKFLLILSLALSVSTLQSCAKEKSFVDGDGPKTEKDTTSQETAAYDKASGVTRIVQYNVGGFSKYVANSIPMVAAMMNEIEADMISCNELDSCTTRHTNYQLKDFAQEMGSGWNYYFGRAMAYRGGAYGDGVVVKDRILQSFTISMPKGAGAESRDAAVVETPDYVFASTHLDHVSVAETILQAQMITNVLSAKYGSSSKPVFLSGDMNVTPDSETMKEFAKRWTVLSTTANTFSSTSPKSCIDFILILNNGARYTLVQSQVPTKFVKGNVQVASDHLPVFVDVKF